MPLLGVIPEQAAAKENAIERAGKEAEQLNEQVKEKVIAMLGDSMRVLIQRSGSSMRRP